MEPHASCDVVIQCLHCSKTVFMELIFLDSIGGAYFLEDIMSIYNKAYN